MNYIVRYRASYGSPIEEVFSANDKAELFQLLKNRHISAISIRQGIGNDKKKIRIKQVLIGFFLILFVFLAVFCWMSGSKPTKNVIVANDVEFKGKTIKIADFKSSEVKSQFASSSNLPSIAKVVDSAERNIAKEPGILFESSTNAAGVVIERFRLSNGSTYRRVKLAKVELPTVSDQLLALATSDELADAPPIPVGNDITEDDNFAESLKKYIIINDNDSEEVKAMKLRVKSAREAMLAEMAAGMSFGEVIAAEQRMAREDAKTLHEAQAVINKALNDNKQEEASRIYTELSKALLDMGIEGLTLDPDPDDIGDDEDYKFDTMDLNEDNGR